MKLRRPALEPELMDDPRLPTAETQRALGDLERVNRWLLGLRPVLRTMRPLLGTGPGTLTLVDLGTGGCQVPAALARQAAKRRIRLTVLGVDRKLNHLLWGKHLSACQLRVVAEAEALPFRDRSFDWSLSNLFFHHFEARENRRILAEMCRVAERGAVVVDLRRSLLSSLLASLLLPLLGVGRVALFDGRLSTRQAWTLSEVARLTEGFDVQELCHRFPFRFSLVLGKSRRPAAASTSSGPQ